MQTLLAEPRSELTDTEVLAALGHPGVRPVRHGVDVLDLAGRLTGERVSMIEGSVSWSYRPTDRVTGGTTESAAVRRQASLTVGYDPALPIVARRFRPWSELRAPSGRWARFWLGVFDAPNPPLEDDGVQVTRTLALADKSFRWAQDTLSDPQTVDVGAVFVDVVKADLSAVYGETVFSIPTSSVTATEAWTFEAGTSYLAKWNTLLEAAGLDQLSPDEAGRPATVSLAALSGKGPEWAYGPAPASDPYQGRRGKIVTAGAVDPLLARLPNVVRFVARSGPGLPDEGNGIRTLRNPATGPSSIDQVGEQPPLIVEVDAEDQEQLDEVAYADAQRYFAGGGLRFTGQVALNPLHGNRDVVRLEKPRLGLGADWLVTSWSYPLKKISSADAVLMPIVCEQRVGVTV